MNILDIFKRLKEKIFKSFEKSPIEYMKALAKGEIKMNAETKALKDAALKEINMIENFPGKGKTCIVHGKYSREYTDYYLNQLADFFEFDFFKNRINELKLEENQRFKPIRDFLESYKLKLSVYRLSDLERVCQKCLDSNKAKESFGDMMLLDSLIMNNKRNIDNFGFIVDKNDESKIYEFVCFYDEYNSMFDWFNGTELEQDWSYILRMPKTSWFWNNSCDMYVHSLTSTYITEQYRQKFIELENLTRNASFFKDNEQFQIEDYIFSEQLNKKISVYEFFLWRTAKDGPSDLDFKILQEKVDEIRDRLGSSWSDLSSREIYRMARKELGMPTSSEPKKEWTQQDIENLKETKILHYVHDYYIKQQEDAKNALVKKFNEERRQYWLNHPESIVDPETLNLFELDNLRNERVYYIENDEENTSKFNSRKEKALIFCIQCRKEEETGISILEKKEDLKEYENLWLKGARNTIKKLLDEQKELEESLEFYKDIRKNRDYNYIKECDERNYEKNIEYFEKYEKAEFLDILNKMKSIHEYMQKNGKLDGSFFVSLMK